ncbi:hypothetical protein CDAR_209571 [Caerostris darwini]|uniref:Uncharacterized protein n=1 Tax=Caerostris darwini TaxID=1538125 RepID=A0AAV4T1B8_9ARAC|nr:hypothetical protein CDAR_209571 [Caerostris darwini]
MTLGLRQPRLTWLQRTRGPGPLISAGPPGRPGATGEQKRKSHHGGFSIVILIWPELEPNAFFQRLRAISHSREGELTGYKKASENFFTVRK